MSDEDDAAETGEAHDADGLGSTMRASSGAGGADARRPETANSAPDDGGECGGGAGYGDLRDLAEGDGRPGSSEKEAAAEFIKRLKSGLDQGRARSVRYEELVSGGEAPHLNISIDVYQHDGTRPHPEPITPRPDDWPDCAFHDIEGDPAQLAFLIALALLNGAPSRLVRDAANRLERRLAQLVKTTDSSSSTQGVPTKLEMPPSRKAMLKMFRAETFRDKSGGAERLRFVSRKEASDVLTYIWSDLTGQIGELARGLFRELGYQANHSGRVAVGVAAGELARWDYEAVRDELIRPWVTAQALAPLAAVDACMATCSENAQRENPELQKELEAQVEQWLDWNGVDGLFAAGRCARGHFGERNPDLAFRTLLALLKEATNDAHDLGGWRYESWVAADQSIRGFATWLERGVRDADPAARALKTLAGVLGEGEWQSQFSAYVLVISFLQATTDEESDARTVIINLLEAESGRSACAHVGEKLFSKVPLELVRLKVDIAVKETLSDIVRWVVKHGESDHPMLGFIDAVAAEIGSGDGDSCRRFRTWLQSRIDAADRSQIVAERLKRALSSVSVREFNRESSKI